jgi:hypothetical protein
MPRTDKAAAAFLNAEQIADCQRFELGTNDRTDP